MKRLVVLFDGTWNTPKDNSNVYRMFKAIHPSDEKGVPQLTFYDIGVGTDFGEEYIGGGTGLGLSENIFQGYEWLCKNYATGDEIWIFGFSRGAYTARSLGGAIRKLGLVNFPSKRIIQHARSLYQNKDLKPDSEEMVNFRKKHSKEVKIRFIGVWDTVGSLGIPYTCITDKGLLSWHDTELSKIVEYGYHAIAIDEHRRDFEITPWTTSDGRKKPEQIDVEQRLFVGAHSNVGGGYDGDKLKDISMNWMQRRAKSAGLSSTILQPDPKSHLDKIVDSFSEFGKGWYSVYQDITHKGDGRYDRVIRPDFVNLTIDPSVWKRWDEDKTYRPKTLQDLLPIKDKLKPKVI